MTTHRENKPVPTAWLGPTALILLSVIPLAFGTLRLSQLAGGVPVTTANARFFAAPLPIVVHILGAGLYALLGAFQFATGYRRRLLGWHRAAGRVLVVTGLLVGLSGLWMTLFYPRAAGTGDLLYVFRLVFGSAMVVSIVLGYTTIRRGDVVGHRAWMMRAYALGLGAGTQVLTGMSESLIVGHRDALSGALSMGAGWVINLIVAEWIIRRRATHHARNAGTVAARS